MLTIGLCSYSNKLWAVLSYCENHAFIAGDEKWAIFVFILWLDTFIISSIKNKKRLALLYFFAINPSGSRTTRYLCYNLGTAQ